MVWPRNKRTRCLAQASLIAATVAADSLHVRSTPPISAPQAADNGVTVMSMTSCIAAILQRRQEQSRPSIINEAAGSEPAGDSPCGFKSRDTWEATVWHLPVFENIVLHRGGAKPVP